MVYNLNGRKNISISGNVITLQIIPGNNILENNDLFKVTSTSPKKKKKKKNGYQIKRKSSISKINVSYSKTNLFSTYYESWYARNPDKVPRYLDPCQTYYKVFGKSF